MTVEPLTAADPNSTELRPNTSNTFSRKPSSLWENPTAMASVALLLLLVAAGGAWLVVGAVLSQYRPRPDVEEVTPNPPTPVP
ncbi:MAG: hypothetical protein IGQ88_09030 [Gloeomargaritaceae cyanobacterium C42_A2020_066]|nr:hypothetical protein [Gloeomargaritaceae cyanobacterium C42_A2020_066]